MHTGKLLAYESKATFGFVCRLASKWTGSIQGRK